MTHGHALGRCVTPTLSIESGGRSSRSHPSFVLRHPSLALFFSFRWRLKLNAVTRLIRSVANRRKHNIFVIVALARQRRRSRRRCPTFPKVSLVLKYLQPTPSPVIVVPVVVVVRRRTPTKSPKQRCVCTAHRIVGVCPGACNPCC